jgi:methionyl-tRNA synthetase
LGNLASRTLSMITRYFNGEVPYPSSAAGRTDADKTVADLATKTIAEFNELFDSFQFSRALESAWGLVAAVDKYIVENEPWALAEKPDQRPRLATVLYTSAEALRIVTALAHPVIPDSTARIWAQLGLGDIRQLKLRELKWGQLGIGTKLGKVEAVFPRADKSAIERMQQMELERKATAEAAAATAQAAPAASAPTATAVAAEPAASAGDAATEAPRYIPLAPEITIDDFVKVDLRVGKVLVAEKVEKADKLLRLEVDLGFEKRQVVAGIAKAYDPAKLIGRKVVIVANLAPRKLRGLESKGMIVAASLNEESTPALAAFLEDVEIGARLK